MSDQPSTPSLSFATEDTYLHATDRAAEQATETLLAIAVGGEIYGIPTEAVREIIRVGDVTEVPRTPAYLLGVISVRGAITPVIDLRLRLGFAAAPPGRTARIVIVEVEGQRFGLRVEDVLGLERFRVADIEPAPAIFGAGRGGVERHLRGVGRAIERADRIVIFLDLQPLAELTEELNRFRLEHAADRAKDRA
jgi:purine-binding chemotaxis protein CheW